MKIFFLQRSSFIGRIAAGASAATAGDEVPNFCPRKFALSLSLSSLSVNAAVANTNERALPGSRFTPLQLQISIFLKLGYIIIMKKLIRAEGSGKSSKGQANPVV